MTRIAIGVLACLAFSPLAIAQVKVGDKPQLQFEAVDGTPVSLEALRGKLVLIDFWATWCGPCMAAGPEMVKMNQTYGPQGMQIIGISLDQSKAALTRVAPEAGFNWPHYFDGKGWKNDVAVAWGVNSIPRVFLINPNGEVVYTGHAGGVEPAIEKALKDTPPTLLDARSAAAVAAALDKAEAALKNGDHAAAAAAIAKFPPQLKQDLKLGERITAVQKELDTRGTSLLTEAEALVEQKQFDQAAGKLGEAAKLTGQPSAAKAQAKLKELAANPQARAALEAAAKAEREQARIAKAADALAAAQKLQADHKHEQAYAAYRSIAAAHAGTPAAADAQAAVKAYEQDAAFMKKASANAIDAKAKSMLGMAASYKAAGKTDLARQRYQAVITEFPGTPYAEAARKELAGLKD